MVAEHIKLNDVNIMVYGHGFKQILENAPTESYYRTHSYVVGQSVKGNYREQYGKKTILFSLQFADQNLELNTKILKRIVLFFEKYQVFFEEHELSILLKHHPRFQYDIDPSPLYGFSFTKLYEGTLFEGLSLSCLHITFHSTTTFEAASMGIPTLLLKNDFLDPQFFVDDYNYPLGLDDEISILEKIDTYIKDATRYKEYALKVFNWYHRFYSEIDEKLFVSLIKGKK
ncbi:MAG: hypothetical protein L3J44_05480 [Campylobacteraceae bacterium]|nr:hypothetical protein [Campylobacteraceae bacterium]